MPLKFDPDFWRVPPQSDVGLGVGLAFENHLIDASCNRVAC